PCPTSAKSVIFRSAGPARTGKSPVVSRLTNTLLITSLPPSTLNGPTLKNVFRCFTSLKACGWVSVCIFSHVHCSGLLPHIFLRIFTISRADATKMSSRDSFLSLVRTSSHHGEEALAIKVWCEFLGTDVACSDFKAVT